MRKWLSAFVIFLFVGGVFAYTSIFRITKNFYEVDPGRFYRSAQLSKSELEEITEKLGIKTVISVRGYPQSVFADEPEAETLARKQVGFFKFDLSTDHFPTKADAIAIVHLLKTAPKPILVHCRSGADRTGMISAIYEIEEMKKSKAEAMKQLSFAYWHVRDFHPAMSKFIDIYNGEKWLIDDYDLCAYPNYTEHTEGCPSKTLPEVPIPTRK